MCLSPDFSGDTIITNVKTIYCNNCLAQLFFFIFMGVPNFFLRTAMSFDCYVAIFKQLHYSTITIKKPCTLFVFSSRLGGFLTIFRHSHLSSSKIIVLPMSLISSLWTMSPILHLSCSDTWLLERIGSYFAFVTLLFTLALMICPTRAAWAPFWDSRLLVRGNNPYIHVCQAFDQRKSTVGHIHNTSIAPMLNSLIYTLSNQQVKQAFPTWFIK